MPPAGEWEKDGDSVEDGQQASALRPEVGTWRRKQDGERLEGEAWVRGMTPAHEPE